MSCGNLATKLDIEMLVKRGIHIYSSSTPDSLVLRRPGTEVADELCGRPLIRYLRKKDAGLYLHGDANRHFTTPTPYSSEDLTGFLNLPDPLLRRTHFLLIDPAKLPEIQGPRYIAWGGGIEFILPKGFSKDALINPWGLEVR